MGRLVDYGVASTLSGSWCGAAQSYFVKRVQSQLTRDTGGVFLLLA